MENSLEFPHYLPRFFIRMTERMRFIFLRFYQKFTHPNVAVGGKERTKAEYSALLQKTGFKIRKCCRTISPLSLIEAEKRGLSGSKQQ
jgi:hypothetical protein